MLIFENNETIIATNNHPIYSVMDNNWSDAQDLRVNDILSDIKEKNITIKDIQRYSKDTTVYNLTVNNDHTYFVGVSGILVHNCSVLYRAVSEAELVDMRANGLRVLPGGYETKLFATSAEDAVRYGKDNYRLDSKPNHIIKVQVPSSIMKRLFKVELQPKYRVMNFHFFFFL